MMQLYNCVYASKELCVAPITVHRWAKEKRIRICARVGKSPLFTKEAVDEVKRELSVYDRPSKKSAEKELLNI